jgi:hypothetical protein
MSGCSVRPGGPLSREESRSGSIPAASMLAKGGNLGFPPFRNPPFHRLPTTRAKGSAVLMQDLTQAHSPPQLRQLTAREGGGADGTKLPTMDARVVACTHSQPVFGSVRPAGARAKRAASPVVA